jgi:ribA/ribD-fused uncharacterized protein
MKTIDLFLDKYSFLSNFYQCDIFVDGIYYPTVEHAYQAAKTLDPLAKEVIRTRSTPGEAKRCGKKVTLRDDWEEVKLDAMLYFLLLKFSKPAIRDMLLATGDAELVESNSWGDTFWGVCNGVGENHLGKLLMIVREQVKYGEWAHE